MKRSIGEPEPCTGGAKPKAEIDEFLFLPDRPLNPVAHLVRVARTLKYRVTPLMLSV